MLMADADVEEISIHAPRTGSDRRNAMKYLHELKISIHAPRTGSDTTFAGRQSSLWNFNPRSPHGERRCPKCRSMSPIKISIHAPRTGSDYAVLLLMVKRDISIHAPRTGSDAGMSTVNPGTLMISIHAPRTGSDSRRSSSDDLAGDFNPRSPHGERLLSISLPSAS